MPIVGKYLNDNKTCLKVRFEQNTIYIIKAYKIEKCVYLERNPSFETFFSSV